MTAQSWIPDTALTDGHLARHLDEIIQGWAFEWLGDGVVFCRMESASDTRLRDDLVEVSQLDKVISVAFDPTTQKTFPERLLKLNDAGPKLSASDMTIVDSLLQTCARDLVSRVSVAAGRETTSSPDSSPLKDLMHADIAIDRQWTARLSLTRALCVALRKSRVGIAVPTAAFGDLAQAVSATKITLAAKAGVLSLGMQDLNDLEKGDVLVLDSRVDESFEVMVDGSVTSDICARYVLTECPHDKSQRAGLILEAKHE